MHVGIDFDNTLVGYDELFYVCALERGLIPTGLERTKQAVRAHLWKQKNGNTPWTELQGIVYGTRMDEAVVNPGAMQFLEFCNAHGISISVVSHKVRYPALGPHADLREAAFGWLEAKGFLDAVRTGMRRSSVYFESSRGEKIARISSVGCTHFIDDLPEVLEHKDFPAGVRKFRYSLRADVVQDGEGGDWPAAIRWIQKDLR